MQPEQIDAYLSRIGYRGSREPTVDTLRGLHRAHLSRVPFENLDIHVGRPIRIDVAAFYRKIVEEGRGGFCYELNGAFGELLSSLGFSVDSLSARVARDDGGFGPEFDHLVLMVDVGGRWLADVGFGRSFAEPLSLDDPVEHEAEGQVYRVAQREGEWRVESRSGQGEPRAEYVFTLRPRRLEEFAGMCDYHQTSPASHFTQRIVCSLPVGGGRVTVRGATLMFTEGDQRRETPLEDDAALARALAEHFGIRMDRLPPTRAPQSSSSSAP